MYSRFNTSFEKTPTYQYINRNSETLKNVKENNLKNTEWTNNSNEFQRDF